MSGTISANVLVRFERRLCATPLGTYPNSEIARSTLALVAALTLPALLITRETVTGETPACFATSLMVVMRLRLR